MLTELGNEKWWCSPKSLLIDTNRIWIVRGLVIELVMISGVRVFSKAPPKRQPDRLRRFLQAERRSLWVFL